MSGIPTLVTTVFSGVANYFGDKQKIKAAKQERSDVLKEKALDTRLEAIRNATDSDIKMDNEARKVSGWMDDVSFGLFLLPAVLAFYPPALPHITAGFLALKEMPEWYQYALGMMLVAVWGYRRMITPIVEVIAKQYVKKLG